MLMIIAIDARSLLSKTPTGIGVYTLALVQALARVYPEDRFLLFAHGKQETLRYLPAFASPNVQVCSIQRSNRWLQLRALAGMSCPYEELLPEKPDVWLVPNADFFTTSLPYALTIHDTTPDLFPYFFSAKERLRHFFLRSCGVFRQASCFLAVSPATAYDVAHQFPHAKTFVTPLGVDRKLFCSQSHENDFAIRESYGIHAPYILSVATKEPRKNLSSLQEAHIEAQRTNPFLPELIFVGARTEQHGGRDLGYIPREHLPALYRGAKAFVFPSFYEGFGLPVAEALCCGTPVIAGNTSSLRAFAHYGALLIDSWNIADLSAALCLASKGEIPSPQVDAADFSWDETARKTMEALRSLL